MCSRLFCVARACGWVVWAVRTEAADKERASMIESLKVCDVKHADMHQLQWMLSER